MRGEPRGMRGGFFRGEMRGMRGNRGNARGGRGGGTAIAEPTIAEPDIAEINKLQFFLKRLIQMEECLEVEVRNISVKDE